MTAVIPLALVVFALADAGFAGFRAATGRNARINKRDYYLLAARRGFGTGAVGLGLVALLVAVALRSAQDAGAGYAELVHAGTRMLLMLVPFVALVAASLVAYWRLPMRESTFVILVGLGPFTLLRPAVVLGVTAWSVLGSGYWLVWVVAIASAVSVLAVEPVVHRRWYPTPV